MKPLTDKTIPFSRFRPTAWDHHGTVVYNVPTPRGATARRVTGDRWMRLKSRVAETTLAGPNVHEFDVVLGLGPRQRRLHVTVTDKQAFDFLKKWADRDFLGYRFLKRTMESRRRKIEEGRLTPDGTLDEKGEAWGSTSTVSLAES